MKHELIKKVVIVGGGSAGWMTAAALSKIIPSSSVEIQLIESEAIGTVGVGEATIPQILLYNKLIGIDEDEFIRETKGTFKLGIQFNNWGEVNDSYFHAFGDVGRNIEGIHFYQFWLKMKQLDKAYHIDEYTISGMACREHKFTRPIDAGDSPLSNIAYAYHFDAGLYAQYLSRFSQSNGVKRTEGKVSNVNLKPNGHIRSVTLEDGSEHEADLFIDCSGFRALLIEGALHTGFEDWSHWLPCDRAVTVACENVEAPRPFTMATAQPAGWQWRIPLQHRVGNGHVYCSKYMSDDEAQSLLLKNLDGDPIGDPRLIKFTTGKRRKFWNRNCVAIGLSSGFMEPLESTSLHLVQSAIARLLAFFPDSGLNQVDIDEYNRQSHFEVDRIRDFLILHYHATEREDTAFWRYCKLMDVPETLSQKMNQYKHNGRIFRVDNEMFSENSWFEVMEGQRFHPISYHPLVDTVPMEKVEGYLESVRRVIRKSVDYMPKHIDFINKHCKAKL